MDNIFFFSELAFSHLCFSLVNLSTRMYSPLCGHSSTSFGGLWPLTKAFIAFFDAVFGLLRPSVLLSSNHSSPVQPVSESRRGPLSMTQE